MNRAANVIMTTVASVGVAYAATLPTPLKLIWNVSESVPIGLYALEPADALEITDLVAVMRTANGASHSPCAPISTSPIR